MKAAASYLSGVLLVLILFGQAFSVSAYQMGAASGMPEMVMASTSMAAGDCEAPCGDEHTSCQNCCQNTSCVAACIMPSCPDMKAPAVRGENGPRAENFPIGRDVSLSQPPPNV